jgi:hypothetical protein
MKYYIAVFIRDILQYCSHHCHLIELHSLTTWFEVQACHVQDCYVDYYNNH